MTKDEAKKAAEVMLAYAEGKEIEYRDGPGSQWREAEEPCFDWDYFEFRIKPQPTYRPFKDAEECWREMQKHQPFGWVKDKEQGRYAFIGGVADGNNVVVGGNFGWNYKNVFDVSTFADGTPFGVLEESV